MDTSKFLDEDNIIKKEETAVDEDLVMSFEEEAVEVPVVEPVEEVKKKKTKKKRTIPKKEIIEQQAEKSPIKSEQEIIAEMLNRMREQKISKEIELELHHYLYNNGGSNEERKRCEMVIKNLAKDIRIVEKKIEFLEARFKKGDK